MQPGTDLNSFMGEKNSNFEGKL